MPKETIQELLDRVADGNGYGDPEARLNDDRKLQVLLAQEMRESISQFKNELAATSTSSSQDRRADEPAHLAAGRRGSAQHRRAGRAVL